MIARALADGSRLVTRSWSLLVSLWFVLLLSALPAGLWMRASIEDDIGKSRIHSELRQRMDMEWLAGFQERKGELGATLRPESASRLDFLGNFESLLTGRLFEAAPGLVAAGVLFALLWSVLLGGVLDRFARGGGTVVLAPFLAACGRYFFRLFKLTAMSAVVYWGLYELALRLYESIEKATIDVTSETTVLLYCLLGAVPLLLMAVLVTAVFDYAKIAAVVSEEPAALKALGRGARCLVRYPFAVPTLAVILASAGIALVAVRTMLPIGVGESSWMGIAGVFLVGQLFVVARIALKLLRAASQLTFYRARAAR